MLKSVGVQKSAVHVLQEKIDNVTGLFLQLFEHCHLDVDEESEFPEYNYLISELISPVIKKDSLIDYEFYNKVYDYAKESAIVEQIVEQIVNNHKKAISYIIHGDRGDRVTHADIHNITPIRLILLFAQAHLRVSTHLEFVDFKRLRIIPQKQTDYAKVMIFLIQQTDNPVFKASVVPKSILRETFVDSVETTTAEPFERTWHSFFIRLFNSILPARYGHSGIAERTDLVSATAVVVPSLSVEEPGARPEAIDAIERKWFALNAETHSDIHVYTEMTQFISLVGRKNMNEITQIKNEVASLTGTMYGVLDKSQKYKKIADNLETFKNRSLGDFFESIETTKKKIHITPKIREDALRVRVEQELLWNVRIELGRVYEFDPSDRTFTSRRNGYSFWKPGDPGSDARGGSVLNLFLRKTRKGRKSNKRGNKKSRMNKRR